jgi:hypothetical protein
VIAAAMPATAVLSLVFVFGAWALVEGGFNIAAAFQKGSGEKGHRGLLVAEGIVSIIAGIIGFVVPGVTAFTLVLILGVWALVTGVLEKCALQADPPGATPTSTPTARAPDVCEPGTERVGDYPRRYRAFLLPRAILGAFGRANEDRLFHAASVQARFRSASGFAVDPALSFADLSTGDMLVSTRATELASSLSYVRSDLKGAAASVELVWALPLSSRVGLELCLGLGLAATFGKLVNNWVYETPDGPLAYGGRRFASCKTVNDGVGCRPQDHASISPARVGDYAEPSMFARGAPPTLLPWVSLPLVGVRARVADDVALRIGAGASFTGFWAGASLATRSRAARSSSPQHTRGREALRLEPRAQAAPEARAPSRRHASCLVLRHGSEEEELEQVRSRGEEQSRQGDARAKARHAEIRQLRKERHEPQAGDRDRPLGGASLRREGPAEEGRPQEAQLEEQVDEVTGAPSALGSPACAGWHPAHATRVDEKCARIALRMRDSRRRLQAQGSARGLEV